MKPKFSIITVVFNNKDNIEDAILSVLGQDYENIEYIVVDGASSDGTLRIIEKYKDRIDKFISESDKGIYDALNKGIDIATGDIIGFLHSDDVYNDSDVFSQVELNFSDGVDLVYGDLEYVSKSNLNRVIRFWHAKKFSLSGLKNGWMPPHTTVFSKRNVYSNYGVFDCNYLISADYDWLVRVLISTDIKLSYVPEILVKMRIGGESNQNLKKIFFKMKEDYLIIKKYKIGGLKTLMLKNFRKVDQFFVRSRRV
jgi:glycosyltransferase